MRCVVHEFDRSISQQELEDVVRTLSLQEDTHGIIVQAPLPDHIDGFRITECIDPQKDVDGFSRAQIGNMFFDHDSLWSCTPRGIMTLLQYYDISVR